MLRAVWHSSRRNWLGLILFGASAGSTAQINVTTYHNDNARTGQYVSETVLTPAAVASGNFGKLFSTPVDGFVYAQPLYLSNVSIAGGTHNVLYVATEHDSLYAIDADSGQLYWQLSLIPPGGTTVNSLTDLNCTDIVPEVGITGTPVIDTSTNTLYVVAKSKVGGVIQQALHAINVSTAEEQFGGPVLIQATVPGTAADGNGSTVSFSAKLHNQRAPLLLENGHVVVAWSSHCDIAPWHGWIVSYRAGSLAQEAAFNTSPNGFFNGIWMAGGGLAADAGGNIYFATGNGSWNGTTDFGDSIVKIGPPANGSFPVLDYFTPFDQATLSENDMDLGSGGLMLLPALPNGKQLIAQMGKIGTIYLLDQTNLGKYCATQTPACTTGDPQIVQELPNATLGVWGSPAYWNGNVYWGPSNANAQIGDTIKAFSLNANNSGLLSTTPTSHSATTFNFAPPVPAVSANGTSGGILWGLDNSNYQSSCNGSTGCQVLYAYDATNLANLLYDSNQTANGRDVPGGAVKFTTPVIANGKVYVGSQFAVSAYGLLGAAPTSTPVNFSGQANIQDIGVNGVPVTSSGIDGSGDVFSSSLLGATATWAGVTFDLGNAETLDAASGTTLALTAGQYTTLNLLALGVHGAQLNQPFVITYTDGSTTTFTQSLSDWYAPQSFPGESIALTEAYRLTPSGAIDARTFHIYGYAFTLNGSKTVKSVSLPANRNVVVLAATLTGTAAPPPVVETPVALNGASGANVAAIGVDGQPVTNGGIDGSGDAYSFTLLGAIANWSGTPFDFGTPGVPDAISNRTLALPAGNYSTLHFLATGVHGNQVAQTFTVTYTDGSTSVVTQSLSDWYTPQGYAGEATALNEPYRLTLSGAADSRAFHVYAYSIALNPAKTVQSLALPGNRNVVVLAVTLTADEAPTAPTGATAVPLSTANVEGIAVNGVPVANGGIDTLGNAYSGTLLGTGASWAGIPFVFGTAGTLNAASGTTLSLPSEHFSTLYLLGTAVNGAQVNQVFTVTYTDGTSSTFTQSMSDWYAPQLYTEENVALSEPYRLTPSGTADDRYFFVSGYALALNNAKTVQSLTLPANRNVIILAVTLAP